LQRYGHIKFFIGEEEGFKEKHRKRADRIISLSKLTFPHERVRVIIAEQTFRGLSILHHHPSRRASPSPLHKETVHAFMHLFSRRTPYIFIRMYSIYLCIDLNINKFTFIMLELDRNQKLFKCSLKNNFIITTLYQSKKYAF